MNNYKIKISCTSVEELCYNNKKITDKQKFKLELGQFISKFNYIKKAFILSKNKNINTKHITIKTLEFICDNKLCDIDFEIFIKEMKINGFDSDPKCNTKIHFINTTNNETLYSYNFNSVCKVPIKKPVRKPNNSTYHTQILYAKTS